jgi:proteasome accessory factor B
MRRIFHSIQAGGHPNRIALAEDIEVTTKTIQRDIDFMRDRLHLPIAYNGMRQGYEFTRQVESFPLVELSEAELVSVFVAQKALESSRGTVFEQPLRSAFEKLVSGLEGRVTLSWQDLEERVSFRNFPLVPADLEVFQAVGDAVRRGVMLEFDYKKLNAFGYERRKVEPYHLANILNQWYCFGHDLKRGQIRTFVLGRMRKAAAGTQTFTRPRNFRLEEHLRGSFGVFAKEGGTATHTVRLHFDAFASQLVRERQWHPGQSIQELAGGELELKLLLGNLAEIEPWVLGWGAHVKVLRPKALVERVRQVGRYYRETYR